MTEIKVIKKDSVGIMPPEEKSGIRENLKEHTFNTD